MNVWFDGIFALTLTLPIALLLVFTLIKYVVGTSLSDVEWEHLLLELPIDLYSILATLLITKCIVEKDLHTPVLKAVILVVITFVVAIVASLLRCKTIKQLSSSNPVWWKSAIWGLGVYLLTSIWVYLVIKMVV